MKIVRDIFVLDKDVTREAIVNAAPQVQAMAKSGQIKGFVALAHGIRYGLDVVPLPKGVEYQDLTPLAGKPAEILKPADAARQLRSNRQRRPGPTSTTARSCRNRHPTCRPRRQLRSA